MDPQNVGSGSGSEAAKHGWEWKQMGNEDKAAAVHEEMRRRSRLPPNSSYATQLLRVLNKIIQLLSLQQRTTSQDEELELLFTGLHV